MDVNEVHQLVNTGENERVEFKQGIPKDAGDLAKVMGSFANTWGGTILVGISDRGKIIGVADPDRTMQQISSVACDACEPPLDIEMGRLPCTAELYIVWVRVPRQESELCYVRGTLYERRGPRSVPVKGDRRAQELRRRLTSVATRSDWPPIQPPLAPAKTRAFRGRAEELRQLSSRLTDDVTSCVMIEGIAGVGKTALAAEAYYTAGESYSPFWLACHAETTFDHLASGLAADARAAGNVALADALDDAGASYSDRVARAAVALSRSRYVIFLDDYHELTDQDVHGFVLEVERRGAPAKVVITTRARPHVLSRLDPGSVAELTLRDGLDWPSCQEFLRGCGLKGITQKIAREVWQVSGHGHPMALTLLAARAKTMPLLEVLSALPVYRDDMREQWLTPLLKELGAEHRAMMTEFSVFDRPVPVTVLRKLWAGTEVDKLLVQLVDRFILEWVLPDRIAMHPLLRDFCYAMLADAPTRHARAAEAQLEVFGLPGRDEPVPEAHLDGLFAAWSHFTKAGDMDRAAKVVRALRQPLMDRGRYDQVMLLLDRTAPVPPGEVNWFAIDRARVLSVWNFPDDATSLLKPLLDVEDERVATEATLVLATVYNDHGRPEDAIHLLNGQLALFDRAESLRIRIRFLSKCVQAHILAGDSAKALDWASKIRTTCEAEGDEQKVGGGIALRQMAASLQAQGRLQPAQAMCEVSVSLLQEKGRARETALSQMQLASIHSDMGSTDSALLRYQAALDAFVQMGERGNAGLCRRRISELREGVPASTEAGNADRRKPGQRDGGSQAKRLGGARPRSAS